MLDSLKADIVNYSKEIGIDKIGFAAANPFEELKMRLIEHEKNNYQSGFEKGTVDERTEPKRLLSSAQSIIAIALAYPTKIINPPKSTKENRRGIFCRASWGTDYHVVLREKLALLAEFIKEKTAHFDYKIMVDTGELSDRAVAERAGIGFSGKNTSIITKEFGSFVYLGEIITNIPFAPDSPLTDSCGDCRICMDACPTTALVKGGQLNAKSCLAYLTQTKDFLPIEFREHLGTRIYGCDTCQSVCPWNKGVDFHLHEEFEPDGEIVKPLLKPMLKISNREFKDKFGHLSGAWRGKKPLQRNAIIALAHYRDTSAIELLSDVLVNDVRPVIRGTAAWALGKIGGQEAEESLQKAKATEADVDVIFEIENGINMIVNRQKANK